jgi:predicted metal-dependent phosphoesterase TrpH
VPNPFESRGAWLRCALHAHTTASDGELAGELLVAHYERGRFDVLAVTDHWVRTAPASTDSLVVIPSVELDAVVPGDGRVAHVLALGVAEAPERPAGELPGLVETVAWVNAHGGLAYLAHPHWTGLRTTVIDCEGVAGLEVYNAGCELEGGRGLSTVHWDEALESGRRWHGLAVDDSHHPGFDSGYAWTWVRAAERSPDAVLAALREGAFYGSTGPVIEELRVEDATVEVSCSPAARVTLVTGPRRGASVGAGRLGYRHRAEVLAEDGRGITAARLQIPDGTPYARLEVHGPDGATAWTNALV